MNLLMHSFAFMAIILFIVSLHTEARSSGFAVVADHLGTEEEPNAPEQFYAAQHIFRKRRAVMQTEEQPENTQQMNDDQVERLRQRRAAAIMNTDEIPDEAKQMDSAAKLARARRQVPDMNMPSPNNMPVPAPPGRK